MKKDPLIFIEHIVESIELLGKYLAHVSKERFLKSAQLQDAVIRRVEIIGEAVKNISKLVKDNYPEIPWRQISAMRNILIHEYFAVNLDIAWDTVKIDMPKLKRQLQKLVKELKK